MNSCRSRFKSTFKPAAGLAASAAEAAASSGSAASPWPSASSAWARTSVSSAESGPRALQYGVTEGLAPLRAWIAERLGRRGVRSSVEQVLITSGSQQGIDLCARVLLDPGDVVVTENPTYLAALQAFQASEAEVIAVGSDEIGRAHV